MTSLCAIKLVDFGELQAKYQALALAARAGAVLVDARLALEVAERIIASLSANALAGKSFEKLRSNSVLTAKMRPSEAKTALLDGGDFLQATKHKIAVWRKTMERLSGGEGIERRNNREVIPSSAPIALALTGGVSLVAHLSVIQLALAEMSKLDGAKADQHRQAQAELRRCGTIIADCEHASGLSATVH